MPNLEEKERILVVCVDRDDDLGVKTGIKGPVVGREKNLEAASKLALADPTEADANAIFGAVKVYDEVKGIFKDEAEVEVATITGNSENENLADIEIARQLSEVVRSFRPTKIILVSDGADDELVIPLLNNYAEIMGVRRVIVQQSRELEHTYILIKRYLEKLLSSPTSRALVLGIPGILLILSALFMLMGLQRYLYVGAGIVAGMILLDRAFGIGSKVKEGIQYFGSRLGLYSLILGIILMVISFYLGASRTMVLTSKNYPVEILVARVIIEVGWLTALSLVVMFLGGAIESLAENKVNAFEKIFGATLVLALWAILYSLALYMEGSIGLLSFLTNVGVTFVMIVVSFFTTLKLGEVFRGRGWK